MISCETCLLQTICTEPCTNYIPSPTLLNTWEEKLRIMNFVRLNNNLPITFQNIRISWHMIEYFDNEGKLHRENDPAIECFNGLQKWYNHDICYQIKSCIHIKTKIEANIIIKKGK